MGDKVSTDVNADEQAESREEAEASSATPARAVPAPDIAALPAPLGKASVGGAINGIEQLANRDHLRHVWNREISKQLRQLKFSAHNFSVDPLQGAVTARNLDDFIGQLSRDLKTGQYAPRRGVIIRSAKKHGITRPVCVLQPRDALVYKALVNLAERELLRGVPSWVAFQKKDKGTGPETEEEEDDAESIDWFERWIRHEGMLPNILERHDIEYVVQSDISNFFPSVRLDVIREHLSNNTTLDRTLVRLCCQIITAVHPRVDYADDSYLGLPQEANDTSRVIAQAILKPVDDEFAKLGQDGRYSRFMDDALWGARTIEEAHQILARFQSVLEAIGLYPNSSKTKISSKSEFIQAYMIESNARLQEIDSRIEPLFRRGREVESAPADLIADLQSASTAHRAVAPRPERWSRVTRRIYTMQRRIGLDDWSDHLAEDLCDDPAGAATYLEYFRSQPLTLERIASIESALDDFFGLYFDIEFMFAEAVSTAPVAANESVWSEIFTFSFHRFKRAATGAHQDESTATAWFVAAAKYATRGQRKTLISSAISWCSQTMPGVITQCAALDPDIRLSKELPPSLYGTDEVLASDFLNKLADKDPQAVGVVRSQLNEVQVLLPLRAVIRPRSLLLLERLGKIGLADSAQFNRSLKALERNADHLRDHRTESLLREWV